ncbi:MAG: hypothetical protein IKS65_10565 [Bacteroidales bacterium]|nr:hypothetical protein [Bacteroidales bacterium]
MKRLLLILSIAIISVLALTSCGAQQKMHMAQFNSIEIKRAPQEHFSNLQRGVDIKIIPTQPQKENDGYTYHMSGKSFYITPTIQYVQSMGFSEMSSSSDYTLIIKINQADVDGFAGKSYVDIEVKLKDDENNDIFTQNSTGKGKSLTTFSHFGLDNAYTNALEQVNWGKIALFLKEAKQPKEEPNKSVKGYGDTALEQTIIRWDVQSRPQGADIFWRVVSKTPEVKSSNNKYLMTTPYEATKALDIKGLTYQTSSNVRIILRCEKDGYMPQEKEFDVRMVMDQEEISAFFRLVKEE